jgi:hypothetical protein
MLLDATLFVAISSVRGGESMFCVELRSLSIETYWCSTSPNDHGLPSGHHFGRVNSHTYARIYFSSRKTPPITVNSTVRSHGYMYMYLHILIFE